MWTFPVTSIKTVLANAERMGSEIVSQPIKITSPLLGEAQVATLRAPNGFLIEVFEEIK
jgi:hypothetical protein